MKQILFFPCFIVLFFCSIVSGAFIDIGYTARQRALANASCLLFDEGAVFSNPAGLARLNAVSFSAGYSKLHLGLTDNSNIGDDILFFSGPFACGGFGLGYYSRTLDYIYQESLLGLGYGLAIFNNISLGINLIEVSIEYGLTKYSEDNPYFTEHGRLVSCFTFDFGFLLDLSSKLSAGASIKRINEPKIGLYDEILLPSGFAVGIKYENRNTGLFLEHSNSSYVSQAIIAVEQIISEEIFIIRSGFVYGDHSLSAVTLGFAWNIGLLSVDYAYRCNLSDLIDLGSHLVTIKLYKNILKKGVK